tara:strand:- start:446 stop:706 length:261 start_codon:yes stop_codon:yes gene_type:complete
MEDSLKMVYLCDMNDEYHIYESISFDKDGFMNIVTLEGEHVKQHAPFKIDSISRRTYADAVQTKKDIEEYLEEINKNRNRNNETHI